ncbi:autotransporter assembly complex protein TamA [Devosia sp. CN2-171]|uniref:autotransporter assembly complex protein TamA n=1 Tax=Devosia sp. CN2-171 TaxID=3400909 RepID=UPI003BF8BFCB
MLGLVLLSGTGASAFDIFGFKLFEDQSEIDADAVIGDPQPYSATLETSATSEVESAIRNASSLLRDQGSPASGAAGLIAKARGDYRHILAALYNQGYFGGTISILVDGREAANLPPDTSLPDPATVVLKVSAGPLFRFGSVRIAPAAPPTSDAGDRVDPPESVGFGAGLVARATVIEKAELLALDAWRQQGYAEAAVEKRDVVADHATDTVDVTITITPGGRAYVGDVGVSGTRRMDPVFVAEMTGLQPGDEYDPDDIAKAEKRLARLDVFRAMRVEAAGAIESDGVLPFNVVVEEQADRRFGVGATYSTIDGLGLEGFHLWRNLFGRAERLRLDAKVAGINWPVNTAEFDYAFGGTFTKPGFLNPDNDLVAAIAAERSVLPAYTETSASAKVGMTQYLDEITLDGSLYYERSLFEDDYGERNFSLAGLNGGLIWDARDSTTDPTEGFYVNVTAEPFYEFYYGNAAFRTTAEVRGYLRMLGDDQLVLAGRAKIGALVGPSIDETPPDRLFFAGGGGSVRGYAYKSIGVDQPDDTVSGGRYLIEGSLEARYRVTNDIGVVAFVDGGYVAADTFPGLEQLRLGVGAGVRYYTGLGPLRLDVAIPLNKRKGDADYGIYVGIGQAF